MNKKPTIDAIARMFGCSAEQVRAQFSANGAILAKMTESAIRSGRKVHGYSAAELASIASEQMRRSGEAQ